MGKAIRLLRGGRRKHAGQLLNGGSGSLCSGKVPIWARLAVLPQDPRSCTLSHVSTVRCAEIKTPMECLSVSECIRVHLRVYLDHSLCNNTAARLPRFRRTHRRRHATANTRANGSRTISRKSADASMPYHCRVHTRHISIYIVFRTTVRLQYSHRSFEFTSLQKRTPIQARVFPHTPDSAQGVGYCPGSSRCF